MSAANATLSAAQARRRQPPAPVPEEHEFGRLELLLRLRRNPLTIWRTRHFREPIVAGEGLFGYGVVISDPDAVRHVLVENAANYRKDDLQRTVLAPGLGEGLLTAEGEAWKRARRTLAPLFTPRSVAALAERMTAPAERTVIRMARRRSGRVVDISADMTRVTYDILAETMFSNAIAGGADAFGKALTRYFETQGRIDPLDVLGAPAWLPRIGRWMARPAISFFETQVRTIIAERQALHAGGAWKPEKPDLLDALLAARDPETGTGLSEAEVGANIVTFIGAGHETTANALTWSLYLISLAPDVRDALEAEIDAAGEDLAAAAPPPPGTAGIDDESAIPHDDRMHQLIDFDAVDAGPKQMRKQGLNGAAEALLKCEVHSPQTTSLWEEFGDELLALFREGLGNAPPGYIEGVQVEVLRTDEINFERYRNTVDLDFDYLSNT